MKPTKVNKLLPVVMAGALALCLTTAAQQTASSNAATFTAYDIRRETSLIGTVVKYEAASPTPPMGAHVLVQTSAGQVDVHIGNAKLLQAGGLQLTPGDSVRIVGETMSLGEGTFFAARIVQKGAQAVAVRNAKGFPLTGSATLTDDQKAELRGVR